MPDPLLAPDLPDDEDFDLDDGTCPQCDGEGGWASCGETVCPYEGGEELCDDPACWRVCDACGGTG